GPLQSCRPSSGSVTLGRHSVKRDTTLSTGICSLGTILVRARLPPRWWLIMPAPGILPRLLPSLVAHLGRRQRQMGDRARTLYLPCLVAEPEQARVGLAPQPSAR